MATVLNRYDWSYVSQVHTAARTRSYPWDQWFDGRIYLLSPGEDFEPGQAVSMERVIRTSANRRRIRVSVRIQEDGTIVMQKREDNPDDRRGITRSPSKKSLVEAAAAASNGNGGKTVKRSSKKATKAAEKAEPRRRIKRATTNA